MTLVAASETGHLDLSLTTPLYTHTVDRATGRVTVFKVKGYLRQDTVQM
jgi:hypothetical protein